MSLDAIAQKVHSGTRLSREDGLSLFETEDFIRVGRLADFIRRKRHGDKATFVVNRQINPTNICILSCKFCDFATKRKRPNAYALSLSEILSKCSPDLREVHIVGGLNADWSFEDYLGIVREIHSRYPAIQIKAYTAVEIDFFARISKLSLEEVLGRLKEAGLSALPGGGAEVFSERVRKLLFPFKIGAPRWLEVHRTAHRLGIRSNATMLYGHIETDEERVEHLLKLREIQDETGGFLSFIPLAFQPGKNGIRVHAASATQDLKMIAVSRLLLDNFEHIKAYWVTLGEETASMALHFGADDIDGTILEERIMHAALASTPAGLARESLVRIIQEAGFLPVERDALYNFVGEEYVAEKTLVPA